MAREITHEEYLREKNKKEVSINEFRKIVKEAGYKLKIKSRILKWMMLRSWGSCFNDF